MKKLFFLLMPMILIISCTTYRQWRPNIDTSYQDKPGKKYSTRTIEAVLDTVNIGTGPNTGNGDPLRNAFIKVNWSIKRLNTVQDSMLNRYTKAQANALFAPINNPTFTGSVYIPENWYLNGTYITANPYEINRSVGLTGDIQPQLNSKVSSVNPVFDGLLSIDSIRIGSNPATAITIQGVTNEGDGYMVTSNNDTIPPYFKDEHLVDVQEIATDNTLVKGLQALGSTVVAMPIGIAELYGGTLTLTDGQAVYQAFYITQSATITGVKFPQRTQGVFTGDNFNGCALYSVSGGGYTQVAITSDDANIWKNSDYALGTAAFTSTYAASPGIYMVAILYNSSAQTTAPVIYNSGGIGSLNSLMLTNSNQVVGTVSTQTTLPSGETGSDVTSSGYILGIWLY